MTDTKRDKKDREFVARCREQYDFVRFSWADMHGISRCKTVPAVNVESFVTEGLTAFSGVLAFGPRSEQGVPKKLQDIGFANVSVFPDVSTVHDVPWSGFAEHRVGEVLCEMFWLEEGLPAIYCACPRLVARRQLDRLSELGFDFYSAFEMEFILFDNKTSKPVFSGIDMFSSVLQGQHEDFLFAVAKLMGQAGVDLANFHIEYAPGQIEMVTQPSWGLKAADNAFIFKHGTKEIALQKDLSANFMSKPLLGVDGVGWHYNHSVWNSKTGKNAFFDDKAEKNLSETARHWIGGLVKHAPALSALCAPTVNCYRRFHGPWAPDYADWGYENRLACFRAKASSPKTAYIENRMPSGCCNPYLVMAATIAAGIDGIVNCIECPPEGREGSRRLVDRLPEALKDLEEDTVLAEALGKDFVEWFVYLKREIELKKLKDSDPTVGDEKALAAEHEMYASYM